MRKRIDIIKQLQKFVDEEYSDAYKYNDFIVQLKYREEIDKDEKIILKRIIDLIKEEEYNHAECIHKLIEKIK